MERGPTVASRVLVMYCLLIWALVTKMCSLFGNTSSCTLMICAIFFMHFSIKSLKKLKTNMRRLVSQWGDALRPSVLNRTFGGWEMRGGLYGLLCIQELSNT